MQEKSTVTVADKNLSIKMEALRVLQQLLHCAMQPSFSGSVTLVIHAKGGQLRKIQDIHDSYTSFE